MMLMAQIDREVNFIMAAASVRRPIIGHFGRSMNVIPVERPQDLAFVGKGVITPLIEGDLLAG
jgi:glycerol-3-phosphate O-acyltransferase/dihydroxyacetone phosphate acyltransferase